MDSVLSPLDLTAREAPDGPVAIARPHRVRAAAEWFLANFPGETFYAVKANPSDWVLDALWAAGVKSFDVASDNEAALVHSKFPSAQLAFMHPVKSRRAIGRAFHDFGVKTFALDSEDELNKILAETGFAKDLTLVVRFAVSGDGAAYPLTRKFGVTAEEAPALLRKARQVSEENLGVSFHVGSQCMRTDAFRTAMDMVNRAILEAGVLVDVVDVGGGFPAIYPGMTPPPMLDYVSAIKAGFEDMFVAQNAKLWAEPGRALVAEAGSTVTRVELRKGDALYFSKSLIPFVKKPGAELPIYRHIGIYAFRPETLAEYVTLPMGPFEQAEELEQLRALENGIKMRVVQCDYRGRTHWSIDAPADLVEAEAILAREGELLATYDGSARVA